MAARLRAAFSRATPERPAFVAFVTAGFPDKETTVPTLLALEKGGADVIELGAPFTDPLADGATVQKSSQIALEAGMTLPILLEQVKEARAAGLVVPIVVMGYFNPMLAYGVDKLAEDAAAAGINGFIVVDLPAEEATPTVAALHKHQLSFVPLITPTTTDERIAQLAPLASGFVYCVSVTGVTGQRDSVSTELPDFMARVRKSVGDVPTAVGFGISKPEHVKHVGQHAAGVVVGSAIINAIDSADPTPEARAEAARSLVAELTGGPLEGQPTEDAASLEAGLAAKIQELPHDFNFGKFGGRYIPETLVKAHEELWAAYQETKQDPTFQAELDRLRRDYVGGPTPVWLAERLTKACGGAKIWLKREDLAHTGAHKINNALGQVLLAKRIGKKRVIAETGAGQHGVATATACALLDVECVVYMGAEDTRRQSLNVFRMKMLGASVVAVDSGSQTLKDAINEAMRDWVTNVRTTHYCVGSAIGPHPFPTIVRDLQCVMGNEARASMLEKAGKLPDYVIACVGGGSNAIGIFYPFVNDKEVKLVGVEAGGAAGVDGGKHSAPLTAGTPGVLHGTLTYLMQDADGQISETHSISAGLDYPGVGPEHAYLKDSGRAEYLCITDGEALEGLQTLSKTEGIIPALETAHAVQYGIQLASKLSPDQDILINLSGRGDKDMVSVARALGVTIGSDAI